MSEDDFWAQQRNITDPIHGSIDVPIKLFDIIDTPQFQRLRDIKQMGTAHYVYPGGVTNRFSHCIGTSFLAKEWMQQFRKRQPVLEIDDQLENIVATAGLVHDLGHGPFSHTFEHWMHSIGHKDWDHEVMGGKLFEHIINEESLDWSQSDIRLVQDLVVGHRAPDKAWISQIVANHESGVDVDKFDYIPRDCHYLGLTTSFDSHRLMQHSRVIGDNIAFLRKEAWTLVELFQSRFSLHRRAYQHRISIAIDHMIFDILSAANESLQLASWANDVSRYHLLTDSILSTIRQSTDSGLEKAKEIIDRLDKRKIYTMASEFIVNPENEAQMNSLTAADIVNCQSGGMPELRPEDIILHRGKINFGQGNENPIEKVKFYSKHNVDQVFSLSRSDISGILPNNCQENVVRIYVRDPKLQEAAQHSVENMLEAEHLNNIVLTRSKL